MLGCGRLREAAEGAGRTLAGFVCFFLPEDLVHPSQIPEAEAGPIPPPKMSLPCHGGRFSHTQLRSLEEGVGRAPKAPRDRSLLTAVGARCVSLMPAGHPLTRAPATLWTEVCCLLGRRKRSLQVTVGQSLIQRLSAKGSLGFVCLRRVLKNFHVLKMQVFLILKILILLSTWYLIFLCPTPGSVSLADTGWVTA